MLSSSYNFIAREAWNSLLLFLVLIVCVYLLTGFILLSLFFFSGFLFFLYLFRDPFRYIPASPLAILSPAYGKVTLIEDEAIEFRLKAKTKRIQIKTRFFDVYSLRSPIEGKVVEQWFSGADKNEPCRHMDFYIKSDEDDDVVTAIRLKDIVRKFYFYCNSGERVGHGQRCGYLYFGGVIDIFIPLESNIQVKVGDYVESGSTILAQLIHSDDVTAIKDKTIL